MISALKLRESLEQVYKLYPKTKAMVLISYSLGGLLAQMQAVTTGMFSGIMCSGVTRITFTLRFRRTI